ncbi:hypothetical protein [Pseudomonas sp. F(2018)]|uniref:hypothetical protein n=1 Tax=Pseudomonas sp. F(2018) TaxID=2502240 RepID=UPI0010F979D0|nr:hypothetical protein [Pseudomonas sp. F(2018)]
MDEINPYAAPTSGFADVALVSPRPFGYGMYKWCSLIYGVGFTIIGFFVAARGGLDASFLGMVVASVVLAPSISYLLVATRSRRLFYS